MRPRNAAAAGVEAVLAAGAVWEPYSAVASEELAVAVAVAKTPADPSRPGSLRLRTSARIL